MDDIILSAESKDLLAIALDELQQAAARSRFSIKDQKTQMPSRKITVFNIELTNNKTQLTQDRLVRFRKQAISSSSLSTKQGILSYIKSVDLEQFKKIEMEFGV
jgi:hypothetical protein